MGQEQRRAAQQDLLPTANQRLGRPTCPHVWRDHPLLPGVCLQQLHTGNMAPSVHHPDGVYTTIQFTKEFFSPYFISYNLSDKIHVSYINSKAGEFHCGDHKEKQTYRWQNCKLISLQESGVSDGLFTYLVIPFSSSSQGTSEHFLVLFSFHLLILSLDHAQQDFIYQVYFVHFTLKRQLLWNVSSWLER